MYMFYKAWSTSRYFIRFWKCWEVIHVLSSWSMYGDCIKRPPVICDLFIKVPWRVAYDSLDCTMALGVQLLQSACTSACRHVYNWNIFACDVKQPISLTPLFLCWLVCLFASLHVHIRHSRRYFCQVWRRSEEGFAHRRASSSKTLVMQFGWRSLCRNPTFRQRTTVKSTAPEMARDIH